MLPSKLIIFSAFRYNKNSSITHECKLAEQKETWNCDNIACSDLSLRKKDKIIDWASE